jgi:hypothetical protein
MAVPRGVAGRRGGPRGKAVAFACAAALVVLAACSGSGYHYVKKSTDSDASGTYFKVPDGWRIYNENEFVKSRHLSPTQAKDAKASGWAVAFDASSRPTLKHYESVALKEPFGIAEVRTLGRQERDEFSLAAMRNYFVPVDDLTQSGVDVSPLRLDEFTRDGGFHGQRFTFEFTVPSSNESVTVDQVAVIDPGTKEIHFLAITCSAQCYDREKGTINTVMDSWTVRGQ